MPAPCKPPPGFSQPMAGALPSRPRRHHVDGGAGDYYQDGSLEEGGPGHGVGSLSVGAFRDGLGGASGHLFVFISA